MNLNLNYQIRKELLNLNYPTVTMKVIAEDCEAMKVNKNISTDLTTRFKNNFIR